MAFNFQNGARGRRRGPGALSDINIIPLVDVVLVLLIIFMLTAHVMEFGLEIEVPKVRQVRDSSEELPVVSLDRSGNLFLNEKPVNINNLSPEIRRRFPRQKAVYVRCDKNTIFDPLAQVISILDQNKIDVRLVTQPDDAGRK
jgi:biopolymer transport protein ExbD/biopolymer transport protein TolR